MQEQRLTIGEMATLNHISTQTLRLYDKEELLSPIGKDKLNGYRYYTIEQCAKLDMIQTLKMCGMTLKQIKDLFQEESLPVLMQTFGKQEDELKKKLEQLQISLRSLSRIQENLVRLQSLPKIGEVFLEYIPERTIDTITTSIDFFTQGYVGYEYMLRQVKEHLLKNNISTSYFTTAGTMILKKDLLEENYVSNTTFIFIDEFYPDTPTKRTIPSGMFLSICLEDASKELTYAKYLVQVIKDRRYTIVGDYLCEIISEYPLHSSSRNSTYKIQIPIIVK